MRRACALRLQRRLPGHMPQRCVPAQGASMLFISPATLLWPPLCAPLCAYKPAAQVLVSKIWDPALFSQVKAVEDSRQKLLLTGHPQRHESPLCSRLVLFLPFSKQELRRQRYVTSGATELPVRCALSSSSIACCPLMPSRRLRSPEGPAACQTCHHACTILTRRGYASALQMHS